MKDRPFFAECELLLRVLPYVAEEKEFALKGGTAINFFLRDLPRLSVDIDLTYLPLAPREESLKQIGSALERISKSVRHAIPKAQVRENFLSKPRRASKLFIREGTVQIKIEPNEVLRGSVYPPEEKSLSPKAEESFGLNAAIKTLSAADLYGGKICAALDRQHPRDFFDLKILLENEGIAENIRKAFVVYLASTDRPMHELFGQSPRDFSRVFETELLGMAMVPVRYEELEKVRDNLVPLLKSALTMPEKQFLISLKEGNPQWDLLGLQGIDRLPGVQWKLMNIRKMDKRKHAQMLAKLKKVLDFGNTRAS
jgi:predicted nucleotidyltransferase component of viral defense system